MRTFKATVEVEFHVSDTLYDRFNKDDKVIQEKFEEQLMWQLKAKDYKPKIVKLDETKDSRKANKGKTELDAIIEEADATEQPVKKRRKRRTKAEMELARQNGEA